MSRKIFWQRVESYLMGPQGLQLKGLRSYMWVSTDTFQVFCKAEKWVYVQSARWRKPAPECMQIHAAPRALFCTHVCLLVHEQADLCRYFRHDYQKTGCVYYCLCLSEQVIKVTQAHLILVYSFHKLYPFGLFARPFIFATISNKIVQCLPKIDKTLRKQELFHS